MISAAIDLSTRPPEVVRRLDFEAELAAALAEMEARRPDLAEALATETDPLVKELEVVAYLVSERSAEFNDRALATFVQFAPGAALDLLAADRGITRRVIRAADPAASPPVAEELEPDDELRARVLDALEAFTTCGTPGAYRARALEASGAVLDAVAVSPSPAVVDLYVLGRDGTGGLDEGTIAAVDAYISPRKPVAILVTVRAAAIIEYAVEADLVLRPGPSAAAILAEAQAAVEALVVERRALGLGMARSAIYAALHRAGAVERVDLASPAADVVCEAYESSFCTSITLRVAP